MFSFDLPFTSDDEKHQLRADLRVALVGGVIAALIMGSVVFSVGQLSTWEARSLLDAALPTVRFLCSSLMTAAATTLALMLTLLGLSTGSERQIRSTHFERIRQIAFVDVVAFVGATLLLAVLIVPFSESAEIPAGWYKGIYYAITVMTALLSGVLVAVMLLLYAAVRDLIRTVSPDGGGPLYADDDPADDPSTDGQQAETEPDESRTARRA